MSRNTLNDIRKLKKQGKKIACLTAYDASFASLIEEAEADIILVGDSLGMVVQGHDSTLPVTVEDMIYHCRLVHRGTQTVFLMVDMPFMSYATPDMALNTATRLMQEGQAQMVKLEGGSWLGDTVKLLTERGIPVCGHIGLIPQSVHQFGGYHVQGRTETRAEKLRQDALALQNAGASLIVLECMPDGLVKDITQTLDIPAIGIGAGSECDGQVLVLYDILGISPKIPSFAKNFLAETNSIHDAIKYYVQAVKTNEFPSSEYTFK